MTGPFQSPDQLVIPQPFISRHISTIKRFFAEKITDLAFDRGEVGTGDWGIELK
jgi:hypothetical protein